MMNNEKTANRLDELSVCLDRLRNNLGELRAELDQPGANQEKSRELADANRMAIAALEEEFLKCWNEINEPVRLANQRLRMLNGGFLNIRAEQSLLEDRVDQIEHWSA